MSDRAQVEEGFSADTLSVLAAVRGMAAAALVPSEGEGDDRDVSALLIDGLLERGNAGRVRRVRLQIAEQEVYEPRSGEGTRQVEAIGERAMRQAVTAIEPIPRLGPDGRVTALMAPLVSRAGAIDVFVLESEPGGGGLSTVDRAVIATLRDQAAAALAVRHAQAEARLDPLTGCLNHGAMHAALEREVARAQRHSGRLACVMLDLDDFKCVNERFGHPVGDDYLRAASSAMLEECRRYDLCCRYGGDEFLVILPDTGIVDAVRTAERLREAVVRAVVEVDGERIAVAATAGVADWRVDETAAALLARVDKALITGKGAGKDRIGLA